MLEGALMPAPLWPARGGAAGSRFADLCLRMNLLPTLDAHVFIRPSAGLSHYSDDLSTQSFGRKLHVREVETQSVALLIEMPMGAGPMVAADKGHVVASDPKVAPRICSDLWARGDKIHRPSSIRLLGVDFAGAGKPGRATRNKRLAKVKGRIVKLKIARAAGVTTARFFKAANEPAALYATE